MNISKNKITIVNYAFTGGGSERVLCNFASLFSQMGYQVDHIILSKRVSGSQIDKNINVIKLLRTRSVYCLFDLIKYFINNNGNIIISSQRHINLIVLIAKVLSFSRNKIFVRESTCYNLLIDTEPFLKKVFIKLFTPIFYRLSYNIICPAEDVKIDFLKSYPYLNYKIKKIYNPIDFNSIINESKKEQDRDLVLPDKFAVAVCRLSPEKNLQFLINAFSRVSTKGLKLLILGEGRDRENVETLIQSLNLQDKVILLGHVKNPYSIVSKAILSLSTSVVEGLPNAVLESIALETPILALRSISGVEELLRNNKCGYTIDTNDSSVFASKIDEIISRNIRINLLDEFKSQYSFLSIGEKFEELF